jgi:fumarylacetoacetase
MYALLDFTHDPTATSWVEGADHEAADFPLQNLPHGVFRRRGTQQAFRGGIAIGHAVLDLAEVQVRGGLGEAAALALHHAASGTLNGFMALGPAQWSRLRHALFAALKTGSPDQPRLSGALLALAESEHALPAQIGDFTDFFASLHHATRTGAMLRPENPLLPNYKYVPVAYHGRSSSIDISGHAIRRPCGQIRPQGAEIPVFGPTKRLDFELELGLFVGPGNAPGTSIPVDQAEDHLFGACVLNDWSARDIQAWEYQPLGPFLAKNFATTISPWIVTMQALAPFRRKLDRPPADPPPLPHLAQAAAPGNAQCHAALDIRLRVALQSAAMCGENMPTHVLAESNASHAYWSVAQMVAHHTSNGCNLRPGDLLGTGTLSGPAADQLGSMLELTGGGTCPVKLPDGQARGFLEDGDTVVMQAWCEAPNARRIGFGKCSGVILPAIGA